MFWPILLWFFLFISLQSNAKPENHSLHYMYTGLTKAGPFPVFSAVGESDNIQIVRYSNEKQVWIRDNLTVDDWNKAPAEPPETREEFLNYLYDLSRCTPSAECSELHVLQRISGCELEKLSNGTVKSRKAFDEFAYDGKDFITLKYDLLPWLDKGIETKMDHQTGRNPFLRDFLVNCSKWISTFDNTYKSPPDVHVFARKSPDHSKLNLSCLTTGFYPKDVEMNIRLDRTVLGNQISSGIRPNDDKTFQLRTSVEIDRNHKGFYDCFVIHSSLTEPASVEWDGICSNCETESSQSVTAGVAVAAVLVFLIMIVCCIYKMRRSNGL
ncbi:HLA class I histocompatibility antigen, alpha chain E-like [Onychostoma macrolepis]|uniref:HLA class I histocompatibility antigen, alpha chain E-like n=1 Tax=Onychostoma macrolepis TaxID=369639 RepID=UPI00272BC95C|nr:HLA class I histocompatibility antigen, alpha chain E-like [Onychostoma macrolepis]